jgi:Zn-dependent protease with chaperone function
MWNNLKTTILLAAMTGLLMAIGHFWGGQKGLTFALIFAAVMNLGTYFFLDRIALATSGARPISRSREYEADHTGAGITGNPMGLARALDKIDKWSKQVRMQVDPSMAHLYCAKPLTAGKVFSSLFSTHPSMPQRLERLIGRDFI